MPGPFIIRSPQSSEEWEVVKKLLIDYRNEFDDQTCFTSFEQEMDNIEVYYSEPDKIKLIALDEENGMIAGCVAMRAFTPEIAEMKRLYVVPAYRGYKLGRQLAEAIIEKAVEYGYHSMILDTMYEMQAAQQLYYNLGFHTIPPYNQQDESKVICFEKTL
jgi:ribosomal protein S18 acetylase RimI-like enzyme